MNNWDLHSFFFVFLIYFVHCVLFFLIFGISQFIFYSYYSNCSDNIEQYGYAFYSLKNIIHVTVSSFLPPIVCWLCQQNNLTALRLHLLIEFTLEEQTGYRSFVSKHFSVHTLWLAWHYFTAYITRLRKLDANFNGFNLLESFCDRVSVLLLHICFFSLLLKFHNL